MLLVRVDEPGWFKFDKCLILADKCSKQYADEKMCIRVGDFYLHYFSVYVDELLPTYEWLRKIND